jgi:hypothetical protein
MNLTKTEERFQMAKQLLDTITIDNLVSFSYGDSYEKQAGETELMTLERCENGSDYIKVEITIKRNK